MAPNRLTRWRHSARQAPRGLVGAGLIIVGGALLLFLAAPLVAPHNPNALDIGARLSPPSTAHLMGTDAFGRDIFSRVLFAGRLDLEVIVLLTYIPMMIGLVIGAVSGYYGGRVDTILMRTVDAVIAFPFLVFVIAIIAILGPGLKGVLVGAMSVGWAIYARVTRGEMLRLRNQDYMRAARALGYSDVRILGRHALPTLLRVNLIYTASDLVLNLLLLASLSYLGLGVRPPTPELGAMVQTGQAYLLNAWWVTTLPGAVIVVLGIGFSLLGDGIADRLAIPGGRS